jgi:hypothetical protein
MSTILGVAGYLRSGYQRCEVEDVERFLQTHLQVGITRPHGVSLVMHLHVLRVVPFRGISTMIQQLRIKPIMQRGHESLV